MESSINTLYPIFLKPNRLRVLIVGGGNVAHEKLLFLLKSSPETQVTIVAPQIKAQIRALVAVHSNAQIIIKAYSKQDLNRKNLVLAATGNKEINMIIRLDANEANILVNVADTPKECDFYLGSIVTKGDLKIAISTNGKSPTFAKRFRQVLESALPDSLPATISNLAQIRNGLNITFSEKVKELNAITSNLVSHVRGLN